MHPLRICVVGNGMVGHHFVEQLAQHPERARFDITVIGEEPRIAYDRVHLSEYFGERTAEDLALGNLKQYQDWGVSLRLNCKVTEIDRAAKSLSLSDGSKLSYDHLVLATGSYPFVPPIPGTQELPYLLYRTIEDLESIQEAAHNAKVGVVVGGGLLGLEAANALRQLGLETHVVEFAPTLMPVQLDPTGGDLLKHKIEALGLKVHTSTATRSISKGEQHRLCMHFAEGHLETDLIVFSAGIRPRDELGRQAGLTVGERGGIQIDGNCLTSDPNIYAIGECALFEGRIYGLVAPGYTQARSALAHLVGKAQPFMGADMSTKLKLLGVEVGSIGDAHAHTAGAQCYWYSNQRRGVYKKLVTDASGEKMLGAVLVGDTHDYDTLLQYYLNGIKLPEHPDSLILPQQEGGAPALGAAALPATAILCSCHNVTKQSVIDAIDSGHDNLAAIKEVTKASTGCGGCAALLKQVVDHELGSRGVSVSKAICEHFNHSRQELFHIAQVEKIQTFEEMLARHGHGQGCDVCKPTVGSILASLWNDYVLKPEHVGLQDTNDTFLANMQKDGTYSVVPRIAGGEITPDKLIVIGQVAKQYNLYTKITGGQRIDLFGARLEDLPAIWKQLIDAGFETGQAYGKSVRTVKSCVGSTWCRYGVQDSVSMALDIENRYKGLRAPHKLKFAVSGCTRECAEAQSKDVGVIATEKGWNLYVCGNGGMKPRHADLFATDLDDETLIRYIDRFLMFYIRTADRLQRTSVWMQNLEGGLDYLREVVINDSLGLGAELEAQMGHVVGTFQCEWKTTIEDPERLKRFRPFINSEQTDDHPQFVEERGQRRPARPEERLHLKEVSE